MYRPARARSPAPGTISREPEVFYRQFGESSIDFDLRIWLAASDEPSFLAARSEAIIAVKEAFDEHKIVIPFPIRTLDLPAELVARLGAPKTSTP